MSMNWKVDVNKTSGAFVCLKIMIPWSYFLRNLIFSISIILNLDGYESIYMKKCYFFAEINCSGSIAIPRILQTLTLEK